MLQADIMKIEPQIFVKMAQKIGTAQKIGILGRKWYQSTPFDAYMLAVMFLKR